MFWRTTVPSWHLTWRRADDICLHNHRYIPNDMHSSFNSCSFFFSCYGTALCGVALADDTTKHLTFFHPSLVLVVRVSPSRSAEMVWSLAGDSSSQHRLPSLRGLVFRQHFGIFFPRPSIYVSIYPHLRNFSFEIQPYIFFSASLRAGGCLWRTALQRIRQLHWRRKAHRGRTDWQRENIHDVAWWHNFIYGNRK